MKDRKRLDTSEKALAINLDLRCYGVFAEIGAGQETANWFFRVSGSSGTVAKTISAYDMTMSDVLYGKAHRYVSLERLQSMIKYEYKLLDQRLGAERGAQTTFFSFCNTVRARAYKDSGECHGWLGIRLQLKPESVPCDIVLHIRLLDKMNADQMEALGKVGVNLIYAAFYYRESLHEFVESLADGLKIGSVEIDMLRFSGEDFRYMDNRLCALRLVQSGLTDAAIFDHEGAVVQAADALYQHPILLLRGSFDPVLKLHLDMMQQSRLLFSELMNEEQRERSLEICEISMNNLLRDGGALYDEDFIDRADALQALGKTVLISRSAEFHKIASYLSRYTTEPIAIILSIGLLNELFKAKWSVNLPGGVLESFGRLFKNRVELFVYPWYNAKSMELVTAESFRAPEDWQYFYRHLVQNKRVRSIGVGDPGLLTNTGRQIMKKIKSGDESWLDWVPVEVHPMVKRKYNTIL